LGEHSYIWFMLATAGAVGHRESRGVYLRALRTVASAELAAAALKRLVRRRRPRIDELPGLVAVPSDLSYPSAHATTSFAAANILATAMPPAPLYGAAMLMAATRPYLGVHYPSDVLAGMLLGVGLAKLVP
jgi:membrane-associated phospholipid phosphatase